MLVTEPVTSTRATSRPIPLEAPVTIANGRRGVDPVSDMAVLPWGFAQPTTQSPGSLAQGSGAAQSTGLSSSCAEAFQHRCAPREHWLSDAGAGCGAWGDSRTLAPMTPVRDA